MSAAPATTRRFPGLVPVWTASLATLAAACGAGTAAVASLGGGSSGGTPETTVGDVVVTGAKVEPAGVQFTLRGQLAATATVEYGPVEDGEDGAGEPGVIAVLEGLTASPDGDSYEVPWYFVDDVGEYGAGLVVRVTLDNGRAAETDRESPLSVGNRPPMIDDDSVRFPEGELVGPVPLEFAVSDDDDLLDVRIEVNVDEAGGFPDGAWTLARPVLAEAVPDPTFDDVFASSSGTLVSFTWDVERQFPSLDSGVLVRLRVHDQDLESGTPLEEDVWVTPQPIRVDNNEPPDVTLDDLAFVLGDDRRLGIVAPYTVSDAEGDVVDLVFQWTVDGEPFPELPDDASQLDAILADPELRREKRIATPYPQPLGGRTVPTGAADTLILPELGASRAHLLEAARQPGGDLGAALERFELELLRASAVPQPLVWPEAPLNDPVAAVPAPGGTTAWVLDREGGAWRVREIDLATGDVVAELASGPGEPDTLALEVGASALLVASHEGTLVRLARLDLDSGSVRALFDEAGPQPGAAIRGVASLGTGAAVFTLGEEILRVDYAAPVATVTPLVGGLAAPWGVVVDPVETNHLFVAERDGGASGRLLSVALDTFAVRVRTSALPRPESLALEARGARLLAMTDADPFDGVRELRAVALGDVASISVVAAAPVAGPVGLATGADGLRLLAVADRDELAAGGGVVQRRAIVAYDPARRIVTVDPPFAPASTAPQPWRVRLRRPTPLRLSPGEARRGGFVWDSRDLPGGRGLGRLRVTARDADAASVEHEGSRRMLSGLEGPPLTLGGSVVTDFPTAVEAADLDGDGDLDLVCACKDNDALVVFLQDVSGGFLPGVTVGDSATTPLPQDVEVADLNGDGRPDLVSANNGNATITVFFQTSPGSFDPTPLVLGGPTTTFGVSSVEVADLDGDGDLDLVCANESRPSSPETQGLTVFFQTAPGVFDPDPLGVGGPAPLSLPRSVVAADLDGDGDVDLADASPERLALYFQTSPGAFDPTPLVLSGRADPVPAAADLDGDGDVDLAVGNEAGLAIFFQREPGAFDPTPVTLSDPSGGGYRPVVAADVDEDGDLDLVTTNDDPDALRVFFQTAPGSFHPTPLSLAVTAGAVPWSVAVADLDGNGALDVVSADSQVDTLSVFFQQRAGAFDATPVVVGSSLTKGGPRSVAAVDMDGDGDLDLVSANVHGPTLTVFSQTSSGEFDPTPVVLFHEEAIAPFSVAAADVDGDGDLDLASANKDSGNLALYVQRSPGAFVDPPRILGRPVTNRDVYDVEIADLDGNGEPDLVSANRGTDSLTIFHQTLGRFSPQPLSLTTEDPVDVEVADLDGNGALDLVSASFFGDSLTVFLGPTFDASTLATHRARDVAAADLDGDGDLDLAAANRNPDMLSVFFQQASATFDPTPLVLSLPEGALAPTDVEAADLDRDGDLDLVGTTSVSASLVVFSQTGPGVFAATGATLGDPATNGFPVDVEIADVDGDGDLDLVTASETGNTLTIFTNAHHP